jgi:DNA-binding PadR family transcriptional regulator
MVKYAKNFLDDDTQKCGLYDDGKITLLRLAEQVDQITQRLERMGISSKSTPEDVFGNSIFRFENSASGFSGQNEVGAELHIRSSRPPLPDPRLIRRIIRQRQLRARFFDGELFADPAWDMLLDLTAARAEHTRVSVTSLCIASGVPPTTALRWISQMNDSGLVCRVEDETDRRRAFITLTDKASDAMARYFGELGSGAARLV